MAIPPVVIDKTAHTALSFFVQIRPQKTMRPKVWFCWIEEKELPLKQILQI